MAQGRRRWRHHKKGKWTSFSPPVFFLTPAVVCGPLQKVTFEAGPQLQFLFHSDSSNNEWGYKFTVVAHGLPDITVSWMSDLQLLVARLMGRLASRTMALKSPHGESGPFRSSQPGATVHLIDPNIYPDFLKFCQGAVSQKVMMCSCLGRDSQYKGASFGEDGPRSVLPSLEACV